MTKSLGDSQGSFKQLVPVVVLGRVKGFLITLLVANGECVMPSVVAGRLVEDGMTFSALVECQVRERTGPTGSLLSMARLSLYN